MNKRYHSLASSEPGIHVPSMVILILLFALGLTIGCAFASFLQPETDSQLFSFLKDYFSLLNSGEGKSPSLWADFWELLRWPLLSALMGSTMFGILTAPALLLLRGFLLSYSISIFIRYFGLNGILVALVVFGIPALCSIVSLFVIGLDILTFHLLKNGNPSKKIIISHLLVVAAILTTGTFLHHWLSPVLLHYLSGLFL